MDIEKLLWGLLCCGPRVIIKYSPLNFTLATPLLIVMGLCLHVSMPCQGGSTSLAACCVNYMFDVQWLHEQPSLPFLSIFNVNCIHFSDSKTDLLLKVIRCEY